MKWTCAQVLGNAHVLQRLRRRGKKVQATGHRDEVKVVAFRKKGEVNLLASGSLDETVRIWGLKTKDAEVSDEVSHSIHFAVLVSSLGSALVRSTLRCWFLPSARLLFDPLGGAGFLHQLYSHSTEL